MPPFQAITQDGWRLEMERVGERATALHAVCVVGHAMMTNRRSLDRPAGRGLASALAAPGRLAVYTFDCRGHGGSRAAPPGRDAHGWTYDDIVLGDIPAVVAAAHARHPGLPVAVVGHSLVGHGVLAWMGQTPHAPVQAVVALAANIWLPRLEPDPVARLQKRATLELWRAAALPLGRFPARRLRVGTEDVALPYIEQFLRWTRRDRWVSGDGRDFLEGLARIRVPVLAVAGAADRLMCTPASARAFAAHLMSARLTFREVRRAEMPGLVPDHMRLVTAAAAAPLWADLERWIVDAV